MGVMIESAWRMCQPSQTMNSVSERAFVWQAATTAEREAFLQIIQDVRRERADLFAREGEPEAALVVHSTCNYIQRLLEEHSCAAAIKEADNDLQRSTPE